MNHAGLMQMQFGESTPALPLSSFSEHNIGPAGTPLSARTPRSPEDFESPTQAVDWVQHGTVDMVITNRVFDRERVDMWGAVPAAPGNALVLLDRPLTDTFWLSTRWYCATQAAFNLLLCAADANTHLSVRHNGWGRIKLIATALGAETELATSDAGFLALDAIHRLDVYLGSDDMLHVYVDQVPAFAAVDVSAWPSRHLGLRAAAVGSRCEWIEVRPYTWHTRAYVDIGAGGSNAGTLANPWTNAGSVAQNSADFLCFKRGTVHGVGWSLWANNVAVVNYGPEVGEEFAEFAQIAETHVELAGWTKVGNEYQRWVGTGELLVLEDRYRLDGVVAENVDKIEYWNNLVNFDLVPQPGALAPGQWARDGGTLYIRPRNDTVSGKTFRLCKSTTVPFKVTSPTNVELYGLHGWGSVGVNAMIYQTGAGGGGLKVHHCKASVGDKRGITFGEGRDGLLQSPRIWYNEARQVIWKGVSTQGPDMASGLNNALWFANFNVDIGSHRSDAGDCEGTMITTGCYGDRVMYGKSTRIGYLGQSYNFYNGLGHPLGFINDGAEDCWFGYCRVFETRAGFSLGATEGLQVTSGGVYNALLVDCGVPTDNLKPNSAVHIRTVGDRNTGETLHLSGHVIEHVTAHACSFSESGKYGSGVFSGLTRYQPASGSVPARSGGRLESVHRFNVVSADQSRRVYNYVSESQDLGTPLTNVAIESDRSVYDCAGLGWAAARHSGRGGSATAWANLADIIARADAVNGETLGTRDANSVIGDPLLSATYRPQAGSPAIGLAVGSSRPFDLELRPRVHATAGALEADV